MHDGENELKNISVGTELTTVVELIEMLKELPPKANVYVLGTVGYLHVIEDENGVAVTFDDNEELEW